MHFSIFVGIWLSFMKFVASLSVNAEFEKNTAVQEIISPHKS